MKELQYTIFPKRINMNISISSGIGRPSQGQGLGETIKGAN